MLHSHSGTHLPPSCRVLHFSAEKNLNKSTHVFFPPLFPLSHFPSSTLDHLCVNPSSFLSPSSHSPGHCMGQDRSPDWHRDEAPTICHSSHPTIDSCLYPLTLSPLHVSWNTMCCACSGVITIRRFKQRSCCIYSPCRELIKQNERG